MIYVACLPAQATGGPELLHQFAARIRACGNEAMMYYPGRTPVDPVVPRYREYGVNFTRTLKQATSDDVLVVPETMTGELFTRPDMRRCLWWLSVDNFLAATTATKRKAKIRRFLGLDPVYRFGMTGIHHLAQSHYAIDFLRSHGVTNVQYLSDYLNPAFMQAATASSRIRADRVLYNPKKGIDFTRKLMAAAPDIDFVPIENMTPAQIAELLQSSKVYIDFGHHPGKDRMPREAAICGCCIITGRDGAAGFAEDLPIPAEFRIERRDERIGEIIARIRLCINDHDVQASRFAGYREFILAEPARFGEQVQSFLDNLQQTKS